MKLVGRQRTLVFSFLREFSRTKFWLILACLGFFFSLASINTLNVKSSAILTLKNNFDGLGLIALNAVVYFGKHIQISP